MRRGRPAPWRGEGRTYGAHVPRAARAWAAQKGQCLAVIYWGVVAAYYSVLRELAFGSEVSDEKVAELFRTLGLTEEDFADFAGFLRGRSAFADAGVGEHLAALVQGTLEGGRGS